MQVSVPNSKKNLYSQFCIDFMVHECCILSYKELYNFYGKFQRKAKSPAYDLDASPNPKNMIVL